MSLVAPALGLVGITVLIWYWTQKKPSFPKPPGPSGYPIIGNLFDMPAHDSQTWLTFAKWGEQYGNISSVTVLGQTIVICNTIKVANDICAAKSSINSDRPQLVLTGELGGWNQAIGASGYTERWKHMRRLFHTAIGTPAANKRFDSGKETEARRLMRNILRDPDHILEHLRLTAGATMLRDTYGYEVKDEQNDPIIGVATEALDQFSRTTSPPYYMVEYVPALKYVPAFFPGAYFRRLGQQISATLDKMAQMPFDFTKKDIANGTAPLSFVSNLLESNPEEELIIKWTAKSLYSGASDTSVSAIYAALLASILFPETAAKARKELDEVVGTDRLPGFADRPHLPYMNAFVKEVLRWNTVTPLGGPHRSIQDDVHDGYFIPKGSIILTNIWKMSHDPATYANPMNFNPERHLGPNAEHDPMDFVFGFGSCPGIWFADAAIYIGCAMFLSLFDIAKAVDKATGREITPEYIPQSGTVSHPTPYKCVIKVRNEKGAALIAQTE